MEIILLFVGASVVPVAISVETQKKSAVTIVATTWIVDDEGDGDFTSIRDAIGTASSGDTICVEVLIKGT